MANGAYIESARVSGASAGGVLIPIPQDPSYVTFPDVIKKGATDVIGIFERNLSKQYEEGDYDYEAEVLAPAKPEVTATNTNTTAGSNNSGKFITLALVGIAVWFLIKLVR